MSASKDRERDGPAKLFAYSGITAMAVVCWVGFATLAAGGFPKLSGVSESLSMWFWILLATSVFGAILRVMLDDSEKIILQNVAALGAIGHFLGSAALLGLLLYAAIVGRTVPVLAEGWIVLNVLALTCILVHAMLSTLVAILGITIAYAFLRDMCGAMKG